MDTIKDEFDRFLKGNFAVKRKLGPTEIAIMLHFYMGGWDAAMTLFTETLPGLPTQIGNDRLRGRLRERDDYNESLRNRNKNKIKK